MSKDLFEELKDGSQELADLLADIRSLAPRAKEEIAQASTPKELEDKRVAWVGKKGHFSGFNKRMGALGPEEKPIAGRLLNQYKGEVTELLKQREKELERAEIEKRVKTETLDITLPGNRHSRGAVHPLWRMTRVISGIFRDLGFQVLSGPEIETEWMNFDALNFPEVHPARDMQDTLYVERGHVLRTHTSPVQIRTMLEVKPPMAVIAPGRVYRHDSDATHSPMFHQVEGFAIAEDISFGHLKGVMHEFMRALYGDGVKMRLRPSFFPFTEPSAEVDIWSNERREWMEVLGCGMIHPNVLKNGGIDPARFTGFAFGAGIDRLTMVRHGITNIGHLYENDLRFLRQF